MKKFIFETNIGSLVISANNKDEALKTLNSLKNELKEITPEKLKQQQLPKVNMIMFTAESN